MEENKLIEEIRSLFEQLKEEEKGQYICNFKYRLPPNNGAYFQIATQLISKAHELSSLNDKDCINLSCRPKQKNKLKFDK